MLYLTRALITAILLSTIATAQDSGDLGPVKRITAGRVAPLQDSGDLGPIRR